ncbi:MAG: hypothetical protein AAGB31_08820 [Bdellovibrio sp.]
MHNATLDSSFILKLKQILASRYGKGLQIRQLMDMGELKSDDFFTRGRDLHIPIRMNGSILGTAIVPSADDLNSEKREDVSHLVRMVLEPAMHKWYLDRKESNLAELNKPLPNLEKIHLFGEGPLSSEEMSSFDLTQETEQELISYLIHLEGSSAVKNKKIALHLHELTRRWAFVPFNDIKGPLHSTQDLAKLGAMTIYVEDITTLNTSEQELILEYISEERFSDEPLFITSSLVGLKELSQISLNTKLLDELSINCFEVDRAPLTPQGLKDVLELFFLKEKYDAPTPG